MLTIARLTYREVLSKKIFYIVLGLTFLFLIVYGVALHYSVKELATHSQGMSIEKVFLYPQLLSLGLYFSTFIVALMAIFSTVNSISGEIETGTIQGLITKPLKRSEFLLGKLFGYTFMMVIYSAALYLAVLIITRLITGYQPANTLMGLGNFLLIPILLSVLSLLGSSVMSTMANGITVFMLYIIGMVGGMVEQIGTTISNNALINIGVLSSLVMPSDAIYRKMIYQLLAGGQTPINVFSASPFGSSTLPSDLMVFYALLYILTALTLSVRIFNKRDI